MGGVKITRVYRKHTGPRVKFKNETAIYNINSFRVPVVEGGRGVPGVVSEESVSATIYSWHALEGTNG